ncbi:MAG: K+-transporting ATPase ATPase C [Rhodospirillaceae bacterium]|nr:MAG: K+-transporting ATPase ATPase C [Rhodospirillaceae bacterium]TNC96353.1 MAG: K+-transporting ATPase ATPase C chain [Stygiobacter sp.]
MPRETIWSALIVVLAVLASIALVVAVADRQEPDRQPVDLRYFHLRPNVAEHSSDMGYASMQVKSVAASRHVPVPEVRRLMEEYTINREGQVIGRQRVDIPGLNMALDERWPLK